MTQTHRNAFTLVELSIVLVILGLLVGGVLTGQSLIRAAELRSISTQYNNFVTAIFAFKDKYAALPGDMPNATAYWGANDADPAQCGNIPTAGKNTCNGDGNGIIDMSIIAENYLAWQHLANAGLIEGQYTGTYTNDVLTFGLNAPKSKISQAGWSLHSGGETDPPLVYFTSEGTMLANGFSNTLYFGKTYYDSYGGSNVWDAQGPALSPADAFNIDTKMDDGKPDTGKVTINMAIPECINGTNNFPYFLNASYNLSNTTIACNLAFEIGL